jgi:hypothetical protein
MSETTNVEINVDTFAEGSGYFVRTEVNARAVSIEGPFADMQAAQRIKAGRLASSKRASAALEEELRRAVASLAGG